MNININKLYYGSLFYSKLGYKTGLINVGPDKGIKS